jgi:ribosomal protein S18 acetylase RimI-like enzyme
MIIIKSPKTKEDFKTYYALRYHVLRENWGLSKGSEKDDFEPISEHYAAYDSETNEMVGVVKLFEKEPGVGQMSHLAVAEKWQHKGIGRMLMDFIEERARECGYHSLGTMTRVTATRFYEKCGYQIVGLPSIMFGNFKFVWMEKSIGPEQK